MGNWKKAIMIKKILGVKWRDLGGDKVEAIFWLSGGKEVQFILEKKEWEYIRYKIQNKLDVWVEV